MQDNQPMSEHFILMSTMSSLNISISLRRKLMFMLMPQLSSLAHKLLMLMFMLYACVASKDQALGPGFINEVQF